MRSTLIRVIAGAILAIPFVLLGMAYGNLPDEIPLLRTWNQRPVLWAEKSLLTVFRVPMIGVLTAAAVELMRRHAETTPRPSDRMPLQQLWLILLVTACAKSLFEGLDLATAAGSRREGISWYGGATLATVAAGLTVAATQLARAWPSVKQREQWRFTRAERWSLGALALMYIFFAAVPVAFASRQ